MRARFSIYLLFYLKFPFVYFESFSVFPLQKLLNKRRGLLSSSSRSITELVNNDPPTLARTAYRRARGMGLQKLHSWIILNLLLSVRDSAILPDNYLTAIINLLRLI